MYRVHVYTTDNNTHQYLFRKIPDNLNVERWAATFLYADEVKTVVVRHKTYEVDTKQTVAWGRWDEIARLEKDKL